MKKLLIILTVALLFLCSCQSNVSEPVSIETPILDMELGIQRAAVFLLIMRCDKWGDKELAAEIEYLKYLISQK